MNAPARWRSARVVTIFAILLAIVAAPAVLLGDPWLDATRRWLADPPEPSRVAWIVVALLAFDIVGPVPSVPLATLSGAQLGVPLGVAACLAGLTLGAIGGYALGRLGGRPLASRLADADALDGLLPASSAGLATLLATTRAVPVFAEAVILAAGVARAPLSVFLPSVAGGNLAFAAVFVGLGRWANQNEGGALLASGVVAVVGLLAAWLVRRPPKK